MEEVYIDLEETPREARSTPIQKTIYEATEDDFEGSGSRATYAIALDDVDFVLWTWYVNFYITILELLILKYLFESWHKLNVCNNLAKLLAHSAVSFYSHSYNFLVVAVVVVKVEK